jgi:hypothetical protein
VVTTTHFVVFTDLDERTAGKAAAELEATRDALIAAVWPGTAFADASRMRAYVLANAKEFQGILGPYVAALFAPGAQSGFYLPAPIELWSSNAGLQPNTPSSLLRHAMTHQLAAAAFSRAPPWLEEGLAQVLETVHVASDGRSVVLG